MRWAIVPPRDRWRNDDGYRKAHRSRRCIGGRAGNTECSAHRHTDDGVDRRRRPGGDGHGRAGADGGVAGRRTVSRRLDRPDHGRDHLPDARRRRTSTSVKNQFIAPTHPGQNIELRRGDDARGVVAHHRALPPPRARARAPEPLRAWWRSVAGRAVVETLGALRPHRRSVAAGRGRRSGGGDGRARQRPSGDLRLLAGRGRRERGEAQARRAVPGGNHSPRHRLRAER